MSWGELPSPDDLEDAALELQRVRDSSQASLKQKDDYKDEVALAAEKQQRRIAHMSPLSLQAGDTARSYVDGMRFKMGEEEMRKRYEREMKTREVKKPVVVIDEGWGSERDIPFGEVKSDRDAPFGEVQSERDAPFGTPESRAKILFGIPQMESERKFEEDEQIKRERARAMAMPGDPTGYVDNLSTIRILELWRGKPMSELDDAVRKLTDRDPYAKAALGNVPELRTNAQRMEARRIMNSEWRFDMSYGDHDYALPQAAGAKRPGLDATQAKLVDVITAIASRSVLSGRYLSTDSRNAVFGMNPMEPFGGFFDAPTSTVKPPSAVRGLFANANWALGIHGDQKSMVDRLQAIVGSKDETWLGDQVNFFGSWLMPSSRDIMGEHRTPVDIELAPLRTMMGLRSNLGLAPKTTPMIAADGQVALVGVLDDSDPLYQRSLFIPNWDPIRARYVYEATRSVGQAYADSSRYGAAAHALGLLPEVEVGATYMNPRVTAGHYFNPYNQRVERFGVTGVVDEKDKKDGGGLTITSRHEIELDHIVSLKYAWDHGFRDMYLSALGDPHRLARVQRFMVDFGQGTGPFADQRNFALTSKEQNQAKSDKGPDQWMAHGIALDSLQHAGNLFHVQQHMSVIRALRARQAAIDGALNPDFMPTSVAEERAIQRVLRGWDIGSNNAFGRSRDEALKFWMETMLIPDLSEDPYYLQARASALMTYATMAKYAATWRLSPYNQGYLLARKYFSPIFRRGWDKLTGEPPKQWPSQFSEFRSARVERGDLRSFMAEWNSQGSVVTTSRSGEALSVRNRRIVAPTFAEALRYARGNANPFRLGYFDPKLSHAELAKQPDFVFHHRNVILDYSLNDLRRYTLPSGIELFNYRAGVQSLEFMSDDGEILFNRIPFRYSQKAPLSRYDIIRHWRLGVSRFDKNKARIAALKGFGEQFSRSRSPLTGRAPLDASPLLTDIYRSLTDRSDGAGFGRRATRALGDIANDFGIKTGDYGFRAWLSGSPVGQTLVDRFVSSPTILGIEAASSYVATLTKQETYVSPIMGKRSLLGHDPFALTRGLNAENLRLTLRSFQPLGGLARIEAMREADRAAAAAAASAVAQAKVRQAEALAGLPRSSRAYTQALLQKLASNHAQAAGGPRHYASVPGSKIVQLPSDLNETSYDLIWQIHDSRSLHPSADDLAFDDFLSKARMAYPKHSRYDLIDQLSDQGDIFLDRYSGTKRLAYRHPGDMRVNSVWYPGGGSSELGRRSFSAGSTDRIVHNPEWSKNILLRELERKTLFDFRRDWIFPRPGELPSELQRRQILSRDWRVDIQSDEAIEIAKSWRLHNWGIHEQIAYDGWLAENGVWRSRIEAQPDIVIDAPVHAPASRIDRFQYGRRPRTVDYRLKPSSDLLPGQVTAALQAEWEAINPSLRGLNTFSVATDFDLFQNLAARQSITNRLNQYEQATQDVAEAQRQARAARRAFSQAWDADRLPPTLVRALGAKGVERFMADLWLSNPHVTMFAGRVVHAPASIIKGAGRVGMAFVVEALENLTIKRSTLTGGKLFASRGFRYGGLGLSIFGAFENLARYDRATGLLEDAGGFSGLSEEQKTDVLSYAHRTPGDVFLDEGLSAATLDPFGTFVSAPMNRKGSAIVRGQLEQDASYRSELIGGILRDDIPIATKYRHRADIKRMNDAGLYPGEGSDMMIGSTRDSYAMRDAVRRAAARQVYLRVKDARTVKEASAARKALGKAVAAARWAMNLPATDDISVASKDVIRTLDSLRRAERSTSPFSSGARMKVWTSTPCRPGEDLKLFSSEDSLRLHRIMASGANPDAYDADIAAKRARGMMERISGEARLLLDPPAAGRDAGFGGFLAAYENRAAGRELVEKIRAARRDSLVQAGKLSPWVAGGEHTPDRLQRFFLNAIFPLDSMERADLERDRLQAAQRLPRK